MRSNDDAVESQDFFRRTSNSYIMGCPPVRGDNPRALASGLSYVQVDKHGKLFYTTNISVDRAHHEIFHAKDGKGGLKSHISYTTAHLVFAA